MNYKAHSFALSHQPIGRVKGQHHDPKPTAGLKVTFHRVIVTPSLVSEIHLRITGPNRNDIKDYLAELYQSALTEMLEANPHETQAA